MPVDTRSSSKRSGSDPLPSTFLQLIKDCDNVNLSGEPYKDKLAAFCLSKSTLKAPVGLLLPVVVKALKDNNENKSWVFISNKKKRITHVHFAEHLNDKESRSNELLKICKKLQYLKPSDVIVGGNMWRNEPYPIYTNPLKPSQKSIACTIERAAAELFGIPAYGVHMTMFQIPKDKDDKKGEMKIWVPTRSKTKQTWPGKLDNTVAGGLPYGMSPLDGIVKEAEEEASLSKEIVEKHIESCGQVSSFFHKHGVAWLQPETRYVFDLEIPSNATEADIKKFYTPKINDGEVESFEFMAVSKVMDILRKSCRSEEKYKEFKTNSALILIDFLIRHKYITEKNEENYKEIKKRMKGNFNYASWSKLASNA